MSCRQCFICLCAVDPLYYIILCDVDTICNIILFLVDPVYISSICQVYALIINSIFLISSKMMPATVAVFSVVGFALVMHIEMIPRAEKAVKKPRGVIDVAFLLSVKVYKFW